MKKVLLYSICSFCLTSAFAQQEADTVPSKNLKEITVKSWMRRDMVRLPDEESGYINSGKKADVINISGTNANIALKTGRQLFSKVPGVFVYDMDGSGNQLNIATRGLDPHRSWEFNIRQNGIIINSDMYAYPASHYSAPMESFEKIKFIRGTGALQYGAQFGGMIDYVTKKADTSKAFTLESINTAGSFNLLSSYTAVGGTLKKFSYYAYYYRRHSDGYRQNSESDATAQFIQLQYRFNDKISLKAEAGRSKYRYHIPGPLNDSMFQADPRISTRSRNYFSPDIYVPSLTLNWQLSPQTKLNVIASGVFGNRSSVMLDAFANVADTINPVTGEYKARQVDIDGFNSRTIESRLLHVYSMGNLKSRLAAGVVYMNNALHRRQLGRGTTGTDYDLTLTEPQFGRDIHFKTSNVALFAENAFQLCPRWTVSPGIRFESGASKMDGTITYYDATELPNNIPHRFALAGISTQYLLDKENTVYGGFSQAYRPVIFKDIVPASTFERIDKSLKDATGYNLEAGARGRIFNYLQYDVSLFRLQYNNRMGTLVLQDDTGQSYTYKTNIGNSVTDGVELFLQYKFPVTNYFFAGLFTSTSYMNARYTSGQVSTGTANKSIAGNKVESVPEWLSRNGVELLYKGFSCTILYSYTSASFSDALNTVTPPPTGARGFTPAYSVWDFNATMRVNELITIRTGVNNVFNKSYFTKRPTFYPGPGIWSSDGRNSYLTLALKL